MLESTLEDNEEMNIYIVRWIIMLSYNANENADNMIRGYDEWWDNSQPSLSKGNENYLPKRVLNIKRQV